jgi:hypothetical protein
VVVAVVTGVLLVTEVVSQVVAVSEIAAVAAVHPDCVDAVHGMSPMMSLYVTDIL